MPNMKNAKKAVKVISKKNVSNNEYKASMPLLNYQERTYVPLRELATLTGSYVDFKNDTI